MTPPARECLVCVYYRVARADASHAIRLVREFQRTLPERFGELAPQVLLRWALPVPAPSSHAALASASSLDPSSGLAANAGLDVDDTLMETYRLGLPATAADGNADATVQAFLDALEAHAQNLNGLLRGSRHVEVFAPCAS